MNRSRVLALGGAAGMLALLGGCVAPGPAVYGDYPYYPAPAAVYGSPGYVDIDVYSRPRYWGGGYYNGYRDGYRPGYPGWHGPAYGGRPPVAGVRPPPPNVRPGMPPVARPGAGVLPSGAPRGAPGLSPGASWSRPSHGDGP